MVIFFIIYYKQTDADPQAEKPSSPLMQNYPLSKQKLFTTTIITIIIITLFSFSFSF